MQNINTMNVKQYGNADDDVYMKSYYKSEDESDTMSESE